MPTSDHHQIGTVLDCVIQREPRSVLDIGIGHGKYGALLREYLPNARIIGVEPWPDYQTASTGDWHGYQHVWWGLWPDLAPRVREDSADHAYDVALMVDVIEHMDLLTGHKAIEQALRVARALVIATPHDPMGMVYVGPNQYEQHRRRWTLNDFADVTEGIGAPPCLVDAHNLSESIVVVLEQQP